MTSESKTGYQRDKHNNIVSRFVYDPTYTLTFNSGEPINTEEFYKVLGIDAANIPDAYDIQITKIIQSRKHKKRRINKKWLKRYGYKQMIVYGKDWKIENGTFYVVSDNAQT